MKEIRRADDYLRIGRLPSPMSPEAFCAFAGEKLGLSPRLYGRGEDQITWVAAAGGAYGEAEAAAAAILKDRDPASLYREFFRLVTGEELSGRQEEIIEEEARSALEVTE